MCACVCVCVQGDPGPASVELNSCVAGGLCACVCMCAGRSGTFRPRGSTTTLRRRCGCCPSYTSSSRCCASACPQCSGRCSSSSRFVCVCVCARGGGKCLAVTDSAAALHHACLCCRPCFDAQCVICGPSTGTRAFPRSGPVRVFVHCSLDRPMQLIMYCLSQCACLPGPAVVCVHTCVCVRASVVANTWT